MMGWLAVLFCAFSTVAWAKPVLTILSPLNKLDPALTKEFDDLKGVQTKVIFSTSRSEYEWRLRSSPHSFDLVIADERKLLDLDATRTLKSISKDNLFLPLCRDELGLIWLNGTRTEGVEKLSWKNLSEPVRNPKWRSRVFLPSSNRFQYVLGMKATGSLKPDEADPAVFAFIKEVQRQTPPQVSTIEQEFLAKRIAVAVGWLSEYERLKKFVPELKFSLPLEGTYFENIGVALVADAPNEELAREYAKFLSENRNRISQFAFLRDVESPMRISDSAYFDIAVMPELRKEKKK